MWDRRCPPNLADRTKQAFLCHSLAKPGLVQSHPKHLQRKEVMLPTSYCPAVGAVTQEVRGPPPSTWGYLCSCLLPVLQLLSRAGNHMLLGTRLRCQGWWTCKALLNIHWPAERVNMTVIQSGGRARAPVHLQISGANSKVHSLRKDFFS